MAMRNATKVVSTGYLSRAPALVSLDLIAFVFRSFPVSIGPCRWSVHKGRRVVSEEQHVHDDTPCRPHRTCALA